ncbi:MAG: hypothetical protein KF814_17940 [Nitrospiraceae bacterium]|nr:hypothetical protein [Nitrospiraceae bacterium]
MDRTPTTILESAAADEAAELRNKKIRRFASAVSIMLMVVCNAVFLFGIWVTGVNFERLVRTPDIYDSAHDICLRLAYRNIPGAQNPVQFCSEWINLSDSTGKTHTFEKDAQIKQGADGRFYFDYGPFVDYRLFAVVAFVAAIILSGMRVTSHVVNRYRMRLEAAARHSVPTH